MDVVLIGSSSPSSAEKADGEAVDDMDMDMGMDFDSDLEAMIMECSQPNPPAPPKKPASLATTARRRAITDRPRFKLSGSSASAAGQPVWPGLLGRALDVDGAAGSYADDRGELWWQRYAPQTVNDLAVHGAKVAQVRGWLEQAADAARSRFFRILVLEGPAGAGKSTCVRVLARELCLEIVEWANPLAARLSEAAEGTDWSDLDGVGVVRQFSEFLMRAERYPALQMRGDADGVCAGQFRGRLILVDDVPNLGHAGTREAFDRALARFVSVPAAQSCPMVLVVTEAFAEQQALDGTAATHSLRGHADAAVWGAADVVPAAVLGSPFCQTIRFNPVAPTIVAKGLRRIVQLREFGDYVGAGGKNKLAGQSLDRLKSISAQCHGDLRSAVTALQIMHAGQGTVPAQHTVGGKRRRGGENAAAPALALATDVCEPRRATLDLFHSVGRVLHAKRQVPGAPDDNSGVGRGRLESDPGSVADHLPMDAGTFQLFVHENHLSFCTDIDEAAESIEWLSQADALAGSAQQGRDAQRVADGYAATVAVRGLMHSRRPGSGGGGERRGGMLRIVRPAFFEAQRQRAAGQRLWSDAGVRLPAVRAAGLVSLAYWVRIVLARRQRDQAAAAAAAGVLAALTQLAMVPDDIPQDVAEAETAAEIGSAAGAGDGGGDGDVRRLVLSDDDIADFSD
ncbi:RFC checkpoint protein Rad17 [Coemansia sp. Benny D115]|nr:RFC checkpoint protein Rad17 [Coemansia sp. Benny D115]